jgi:hypothetical protein
MHSVTLFTEDGIDSGADVVAARKEGGTRRRTDRRSRVKIGEAHATGGKLVENGSLDRPPVTAEVTIPEIVDKEGDDIRMFVLGKTRAKEEQGA